jgi:hypothetical protein
MPAKLGSRFRGSVCGGVSQPPTSSTASRITANRAGRIVGRSAVTGRPVFLPMWQDSCHGPAATDPQLSVGSSTRHHGLTCPGLKHRGLCLGLDL